MKDSIHNNPLVVAISSRALFDLDESHAVFESQGLKAYAQYQLTQENEVLQPGEAFPLVKKLLALNENSVNHQGVEIILISRNSADSGLRIFNSIEHHGLDIQRAVFTNGESPFRYMKAIGTGLFLSGHDEDVRQTLKAGFAAALILPGARNRPGGEQLNGCISPKVWRLSPVRKNSVRIHRCPMVLSNRCYWHYTISSHLIPLITTPSARPW